MTKSMHIAARDLNLRHLYVIYPGDLRYKLSDTCTAVPISQVKDLPLHL